MKMPSNQHYLEKADLSINDLISDGGVLQPQQAKEFYEIVIDQSEILQEVTTVPMSAPQMEINRIGFSSSILRAAQESTALPEGDRTKVDLGRTTLTTKEFMGEVRIPYGVVEDNIVNGDFPNLVMRLMGEAVARDIENIVLNGDTASAVAPLSSMDGLLKLATTRVINAGGVRLDKSILRKVLQTMSARFLRSQRNMKFITSKNAVIDYVDSLANRQTALGDAKIVSESAGEYMGYRVSHIPLMPENLGGGTNMTSLLFMDPKNAHVGMQRDVRIETARDIQARELIIVVTVKFGVVYQYEPALVKVTNILATAA
jgi:HK97 family phage major capsid protein